MTDTPDAWLYQLTTEAATNHFLSLGLDVGEIAKEAFSPTAFDAHIAQLKQKLLSGIGLEVLRGLPVENYTQGFAAAIFCGIGAHIGSA